MTIAAGHSTALAGMDDLVFTVTRQVMADGDLDVPVTLTSGIVKADALSRTVTIAGQSVTADLHVSTSSLDPDAVTGAVTATVGDGLMHDVGDPSAASVKVYVGETLLTVRFDDGSYTLDESVGRITDEIGLIARTEPDVPPPAVRLVLFGAASTGTAEFPDDYNSFFDPVVLPGGSSGDWTADGDAYTVRVPFPLTIVDDGLIEGNETLRVRLVAHEELPAAVGLVPADSNAEPCAADGCESPVTIVDDDARRVVISQTGPLPVKEGGAAAYTARLDSQPTGDVTVTAQLTGLADADLAVSPAMTFNPANWRYAQTVTVKARVDKNRIDGSATITHTVSGADYGSNGVTALSVRVVERDAGPDAVVVTIAPVPDGTVLPARLEHRAGTVVEDGSRFVEGERALFRLVFANADGGPPTGGADVELAYTWHNESLAVPTSGQISRTVLSLLRVAYWDGAVESLENDVASPDGTLTVRIVGCERNGCVVGEPSEITLTIVDDDGGLTAAPPGQPDPPTLACAAADVGYDRTAIAVSWEAPAFVGSAAIEGYEVRYRRWTTENGMSDGSWKVRRQAGEATSTTVAGLEVDAAYVVEVRAVNANGPGEWSVPGTFWTGYAEGDCERINQIIP